jgi:rod shape-determining protein MreC
MQSRAVSERTSRQGLEVLEHNRDSLALLVQDFAAVSQENSDLRALLALRPRLSTPYLSAEILHQSAVTDDRVALIGVGSGDGVRPFDPVVTAEGLIGYVWSVGARSSSAYTWAHPEFRAAAVTGDGRVTGLISPSASTDASRAVLQLRGVALRDSLAVGTAVYTSGLGGVFPRGIPIGRISAIERDQFGYERVYRVTPFAHPAFSTHVLVLISPRDSLFMQLPLSDSSFKTLSPRVPDTLRQKLDSQPRQDSLR